MKTTNILISLSVILFINCSDSNDREEIQRIQSINIFDVGNEGDVSDIRVVFSILNVSNIDEFRIIVIPSESSSGYNKTRGLMLNEDRYITVSLSTNKEYSIRLSEMLDVEGNTIVPGKDYIVRILMLGQQFNQLSVIESNILRLTDQGIYNGYYQGVLVHNTRVQDNFLVSGQQRTFFLRGEFQDNAIANNYIGTFTVDIPNTNNDGNSTIRLTFDGQKINEFSADKDIAVIAETYINCEFQEIGSITGIVKNDLQLEIDGRGCNEGKFRMRLLRLNP